MRTHLVTGARSGIGLALADRLEERGDRVLRVTRADVDLADGAAVRRWAELLDVDRLDSLVHMAGTVELDPVASVGVAEWERQIAVNLNAPALMTGPLLPALRAAGGTVVFVNSSAGLAAYAGWAAYAASKFGLRALADALRAEEAEHGVRVTTVFPSRTATPMQEKVHEQEGRTYDASRWLRPDTVVDTILHVLDLPADATVPEIVIRPR
ncbi:SDR family oxidoreductase [Marmoricola sp. RAF53]|uniref:SDR family oxidoreductase n=1 Tax=Marmoricola sp. RAF53 TaxID=3233059 RepID=UPI003F950CB2